MQIPEEYHGREQSFLKHRILQEYLVQWGAKIGSLARQGRIKLWYVDCFAGPWKSQDQEREDTSIAIGLRALVNAADTWRPHAPAIELGAIFVEKDAAAYEQLCAYVERWSDAVDIRAWHGEFGDLVPRMTSVLEDDPAFIFVDPTGFKGVAMRFIATLTRPRMRDVLVNVMFNDINRFKDDPREFLRDQMRDFFGLEDREMPPGLAESELLALYRNNLKQRSGVEYAADLAVPHPTHERTWFRLVIGGKHRKVLEVFREAEHKVIGLEAARVRTEARQREVAARSGQLSLGDLMSPPHDRWYETQNAADQQRAMAALKDCLQKGGRQRFVALWPTLLEEHHMTRTQLAGLVVAAAKNGELLIEPARKRRSQVKDDEWLTLVTEVQAR